MPSSREIRLALKDIRDGICSIHIWPMLGWQDIKQRYRRSKIGPFWITISTGVLVGSMGPLYGKLLQQDIASYFPYLAIGFVTWMFISGLIVDGCNAFTAAEGYIKEVKLPLTVHVLRMIWKNLLMFAHNLVIVVLVLAFYVQRVDWHVLLLPLALMLIAFNGLWIGLMFGTFCARFRDVPQIVASLVQVAFFLTPILWHQDMLGANQWAAEFNPLYHFLEIVRAPLLSSAPSSGSWIAALLVTAIGFAITLLFFSRFRPRVAYWM